MPPGLPSTQHPDHLDDYLAGPSILDLRRAGARTATIPGATPLDVDLATAALPTNSRSTVHAEACLEYVPDPASAIQEWFRIVRTGGHLLIVTVQPTGNAALEAAAAGLRRTFTAESLLDTVRAALEPGTYRIARLHTLRAPSGTAPIGTAIVQLAIEKLRGDWSPAPAPSETPALVPGTALRRPGSNPAIRPCTDGTPNVRRYDFGSNLPPEPRILVLKLDHLGDFIIGLPSLRKLREAFPASHMRVVVGSWNAAMARACGLFDEVVTYDYFSSSGWEGFPFQPIAEYVQAVAGHWDLAIDIRVDEDTRHLLVDVDATLRCGLGSVVQHPFLDISMPNEPRANNAADLFIGPDRLIPPDRFQTLMPVQTLLYHETDFRPAESHVVFGPHVRLPRGKVTVLFDLRLSGPRLAFGKVSITLDIARNGDEIGVHRLLRNRQLRAYDNRGVALTFLNDDPDGTLEFRVHVFGRLYWSRLQFHGVRIKVEGVENAARLRPANLHIGEKLSLLVQLVQDRAVEAGSPSVAAAPARRIAIAPFSNKDLRDWPLASYASLIRKLLEATDCSIVLLGSGDQAAKLELLAAQLGHPPRVVNMAGKTIWAELPALLQDSALVICNNSGIAHLAAAAAARTLALHSASHQPQEWGPRGPASHALMTVIPCSPCGFDKVSECPYEVVCLRGLLPETVFHEAMALLPAPAKSSSRD